MVAAPDRRKMTYAQYLELERETDVRHEFVDGEAWAMAGGTPRHSKIKTNLAAAFVNLLRGNRCQAYDSDLKVRVLDTGLATYADLAVVCGPIERHPEDENAITNPTLLVEVLSESSEGWDRGGKFMHAQRIPSLRHDVLVSQNEARVEHFERTDDGTWIYSAHESGGAVRLSALGVSLPVGPLYEALPE